MRARLFIAACVLVPIDPLAAQHVVDDSDRLTVRSTATPRNPLASGIGLSADRTKGVFVDRYTLLSEDGSADVRQGVVGGMPLSKHASIGVGLYRVSRYSRGEPNFRKLMPMEDVDGRHQRIAAVGMSIRF